jgi:hypothetical protein
VAYPGSQTPCPILKSSGSLSRQFRTVPPIQALWSQEKINWDVNQSKVNEKSYTEADVFYDEILVGLPNDKGLTEQSQLVSSPKYHKGKTNL